MLRAKTRELLAAEGIAAPAEEGPPPDAKTRPFTLPADGIPGAKAVAPDGRWKQEEACVDAVKRYVERFPTSQRLTRAHHANFAKGKPDSPSPTRFEDHGGFSRMLALARAELDAPAQAERDFFAASDPAS